MINKANTTSFAALAAVATLLTGVFTAPAEARIRCNGQYQVQRNGEQFATPYCENHYLYQIARKYYGVSTSFDQIRYNIHEKERVCRMIGHDSRVNSICMEFQLDRSNGFTR